MKKITLLLGVLSIMALTSCKKQKEETAAPEETNVEINTTTTETPEEADGTSISVGSDGVDISSKDGDNETNVEVGGGDAKIEIKK